MAVAVIMKTFFIIKMKEEGDEKEKGESGEDCTRYRNFEEPTRARVGIGTGK